MTSDFIVAVHALVLLSHRDELLSSETIAENVCTNPAVVRKVLSKLKKAGIVQSKGGAEGGYTFEGNPEKMTLKTVYDAIGESMVGSKWRSGDLDMDCEISSGMGTVIDEVFDKVDESCRNILDQITISRIEKQLTESGRKKL